MNGTREAEPRQGEVGLSVLRSKKTNVLSGVGLFERDGPRVVSLSARASCGTKTDKLLCMLAPCFVKNNNLQTGAHRTHVHKEELKLTWRQLVGEHLASWHPKPRRQRGRASPGDGSCLLGLEKIGDRHTPSFSKGREHRSEKTLKQITRRR